MLDDVQTVKDDQQFIALINGLATNTLTDKDGQSLYPTIFLPELSIINNICFRLARGRIRWDHYYDVRLC